MPMIENSILSRSRAALNEVYDEQIERVEQFGSRARGGARQIREFRREGLDL